MWNSCQEHFHPKLLCVLFLTGLRRESKSDLGPGTQLSEFMIEQCLKKTQNKTKHDIKQKLVKQQS